MSLLEDRILKIIEFKEKGFEVPKIAELMELNPESIKGYYKSVRDFIKGKREIQNPWIN
jgi:hypothetical protein